MNLKNRRPLLIILAILGLLILAEVGARIYISNAPERSFNRFASFDQLTARYGIPPLDLHRNIGYTGNVEYVRGEDFHNSFGYRGEEFESEKPEGTFRIVALGGSATYSTGVEAFRHSYPYLLEAHLHKEGYSQVEVINAGLPGYTSWESLLNFNFRVLDLQPDLVIFYPDIEDVAARLVWPPEAYKADNSGYLDNITGYNPPWWDGSAALRFVLISLGVAEPHSDLAIQWRPRSDTSYELELLQQYTAHNYPAGIFENTSVKEMLAANPPLYFESNLRSMLASAEVNVVPFVLVGGVFAVPLRLDEAGYYAALQGHNEVLATLAKTNNGLYFDLAATWANEPGLYVEPMQFNEAGNQQLAGLIGQSIIENQLLNP
ncbi:MAG: hypothetical protein DWQ07_09650 [Chloroflexi bacterium]|nr:MAG: hypothetical protein DWQ07_09650 [Chloroflexota bacterium]MBL1193022.1 hypothetical protein [Chloroflexota bacterium]NOH10315.1 hypothetical protein [Chloroflexota bacterium]